MSRPSAVQGSPLWDGDAVNERINHAIQQWKTGDRARVTESDIYISIHIYIWELGGASEFDRSSDVSKMNVPIIDVEMFVTMFGRDPFNVSRLVAVDR